MCACAVVSELIKLPSSSLAAFLFQTINFTSRFFDLVLIYFLLLIISRFSCELRTFFPRALLDFGLLLSMNCQQLSRWHRVMETRDFHHDLTLSSPIH